MKKAILLSAIAILSIAVFGQQRITPKPGFQTHKASIIKFLEKGPLNQVAHNNITKPKSVKPVPPENKNEDFVTIISIGTSANAYGYAHKGSFLWADDNLKTITHFHRLGGPLGGNAGSYGYDISVDEGLAWTNQVLCLSAQPLNPRYANHGIYNPPGNLDPDEAYVSYFALSYDELMIQYLHGRAKIGDQSDTTSNLISPVAADSLFFSMPKGFVITQTGEIWVTDVSMECGSMQYLNKIIVSHGVWNESINDFEYEITSLQLNTVDNQWPADTKVAFSPDGQTGWIAALTDDGSVPISTGRSLYPVLWKTTDAGETWEGPIPVSIAGENGIDEVKNFLTDEELEELYGLPIPDRDTIEFTTAYDFDLHVDVWGRPHIAVVIGITGEDPYSIITGQSEISGCLFAAIFDLTIGNPGTWKGYELGRLKTFRGNFGDLTQDNRIQIASSWDGVFMFVTWNDTDLPEITENIYPDIYCRGIEVMNGYLSWNNNMEPEPYNVTAFSAGMWQAYFHSTSHYVFLEYFLWESFFIIPMTYQEMNPEYLSDPVVYQYISDFKIPAYNVGFFEGKKHGQADMSVSWPIPNPASLTVKFNISFDAEKSITITLFNFLSEIVLEIPLKSYPPGTHSITLDVSDFPSGVYFFTVNSGENTVTRKMIVK